MKVILSGSEARDKIYEGLHLTCEAVASSLGPAGLNSVVYRGFGTSPISSRDGVTIARSIDFDDNILNVGSEIAKNISNKTVQETGDATTTVLVLLDSIYSQGLNALKLGANARAVKRGIERAVEAVINHLKTITVPVTDEMILQAATISANNDPEIGAIVANAIKAAGKNGIITVEDSTTSETWLDKTDGFEISAGYVSPYFINSPVKMECILENPLIFCYDKKLGSLAQFMPLAEQLVKANRPFLLIAEQIEGEIAPLLVSNKLQGIISCCAVNCPVIGAMKKDFLTDIAIATGGQAVIDDLGLALNEVKLTHLGSAKKVIITRNKTTIIGGNGKPDLIQERITQLQTLLTGTLSEFERDKLNERLAKFSGGVNIIKCGASSQIELTETKMRIEDSLLSTRCAIDEGIVAGGGTSLLRCIPTLKVLGLPVDEMIGRDVLIEALKAPLLRISSNAGVDSQVVLQTVMDGSDNFGYDALGRTYGDLVEKGVIDSVKVLRTALVNAASVAALLLITENVIVNVQEKR